MEANYGNDELKAALDFEKRYRKRLDIGKSVALGIDLAANLLSTLARSRGASVTLNTNNAAALDNKIAESEQKLLQAQRDYNGRIAALAFRSMLNDCKGNTSAAGAPVRGELQRKPLSSSSLPLLGGRVKPRRPQIIEIKPLTPVKPLQGRLFMKNTNKKQTIL